MTDHLHTEIKVAGHLYEKHGIYQMMLSWKDENGVRRRKSQSTGLPVRGNKKRAENILASARKELGQSLEEQPRHVDILFADFMEDWLESVRNSVKLTTFGGYQNNVKTSIAPYFRKRKTLLRNLTATDINRFYDEMLKRVKAKTVLKYHANIGKALRDAKMHSIMVEVKRPKPEVFRGKFLKQSEVVKVFEAAQGHKLELSIILGAFYGLRRSEVVGLQWEAIDFEANVITIEHTVTTTRVDGKLVTIAEDTTKSATSFRSLPLIPAFRAKLLAVQEEQERFRKLCGNSYNKDNTYIYTDSLGNRIKPSYLTEQFPLWMEKNGFRRMRYHDLRHSCASLLLAAGVPLKQIQEWLGHSNFTLTANTYAHLEFSSKLAAANAMTWIHKTPQAVANIDTDTVQSGDDSGGLCSSMQQTEFMAAPL